MDYSKVNSWKYSQTIYKMGRSLRINYVKGAKKTALNAFIQQIIVTRPWIKQDLRKKANAVHNGVDTITIAQPDAELAKIVERIGRDFKKVPMTLVEKGYADTLISVMQ